MSDRKQRERERICHIVEDSFIPIARHFSSFSLRFLLSSSPCVLLSALFSSPFPRLTARIVRVPSDHRCRDGRAGMLSFSIDVSILTLPSPAWHDSFDIVWLGDRRDSTVSRISESSSLARSSAIYSRPMSTNQEAVAPPQHLIVGDFELTNVMWVNGSVKGTSHLLPLQWLWAARALLQIQSMGRRACCWTEQWNSQSKLHICAMFLSNHYDADQIDARSAAHFLAASTANWRRNSFSPLSTSTLSISVRQSDPRSFSNVTVNYSKSHSCSKWDVQRRNVDSQVWILTHVWRQSTLFFPEDKYFQSL